VPKLSDLMVEWAKQDRSMRPWLESFRPGGPPLNSLREAVLREHEGHVTSVAVRHDGHP
jgi:hypothetical protein